MMAHEQQWHDAELDRAYDPQDDEPEPGQPPGWQERLDLLMGIYDRAWAQLHAGVSETVALRKIEITRRQLVALLAMRP